MECKHENFTWSLLLNEGICQDCMARLMKIPTLKPPTELQTAEAHKKLIEQNWNILYENGGAFIPVQLRQRIFDYFTSAMEEYASLKSSKAQQRIKEAEGVAEFWINKGFEFEGRVKVLEEVIETMNNSLVNAHQKIDEAHNQALQDAIEFLVTQCYPDADDFRNSSSFIISELEKLKK